MPIIVNVDVMLAKRKMSSGELAEKVGITPANLSILKTNKAKAIRFSTLEKICEILDCKPGEVLDYEKGAEKEMEIIGSLILSLTQSILFYGKQIGISMLIFEVVCNGIILFVLNKKEKIQNKAGLWLMVPIILLSSTYFIFANRTFYVANIFVIFALNFIMYVILTNLKGTLTNYLYKTGLLFTDTVGEWQDGLKLSKEVVNEHLSVKKKTVNFKKIAKSVLIVCVVVGIVLILLSSADSIFANLFSGIGRIFTHINTANIFNLILRIVIMVMVYFLFLSFILKVQDEFEEDEYRREIEVKDTFTIKMLLVTLNIVYLVFCFIQIQSLFAKINIQNSFDYANYARSGFFQLMFVSFINLAVILISNRYNAKKEKNIKILNLMLVVFTIIIAISSMYRMHMYEMEYGLTYLRMFVYIILITEIIAFIPIVKYILDDKFDFMKWCFGICIGAYCVANLMNIENIIVSRNLTRESIRSIDYNYLSNIASEDSYIILEDKLQDQNIDLKEETAIENILINIKKNEKTLSWQEFNISKMRIQKRRTNIQRMNEIVYDLYD